ncbi:hypothetical protein T484DRAFT_3229223 [Baffinella frigidus]|nr:hypothetical protein T484DRAFT_3229223 [Cryptophyta sp. CCMP2293]
MTWRDQAAQTSGPKTPSPTNAAPSQPTAPSFAVSPSQLAPQHQDAELGREGGKGAGGEGAVPAGGSFHSTGEEELNPGRISLEMQVDGLQVESTASLVRELVDHAAGAMTTHPGLAGLQVGTGGQHVTSDVVYASSIPPRPGPPALVDVPSSGIPETAFARHRDVEPLPPALQGYADHTEYAQGSTIVDC